MSKRDAKQWQQDRTRFVEVVLEMLRLGALDRCDKATRRRIESVLWECGLISKPPES